MVIVDYSVHDRHYSNDHVGHNQRRQLSLDDDSVVEFAIANFCPRLRESISLLSQHKVGPLKLRVHLSDFQSSVIPQLPTDGSNKQYPRNDRFILALPYFCEQISDASNNSFMVRWSIITQCDHPNRPPDIILLGLDDTSKIFGYGESTLRRSQSNSQHTQRRQSQIHKIFQEQYWQQYVASEIFHIQCLTKWNNGNNEKSSLLQYCILADQLYECYANFQVYKLKMSLKTTPEMLQPPLQLVQAYTQFKQLSKLSKSTMTDIDAISVIGIELFVDLKGGINTNEYEDRRNQSISYSLVNLRVIISIVSSEQAEPDFPLSDNKVLIHLASVTASFLPIVNSANNSNKNVTTAGNINNCTNKKYLVKILNPRLDRATHQGTIMSMMLDATNSTTEKSVNSTMIDFVTYVRHVQRSAIQAYNCDIDYDEEKIQSDSNNNDSNLFIQALYETFCESPDNGNCLLDYHISNANAITNIQSSIIRFLLVDKSMGETSQLNYILNINYNTIMHTEYKTAILNKDFNYLKDLVPILLLRSVYEDESTMQVLQIDIRDLMIDYEEFNNTLVNIIKISTLNAIHQLRSTAATPILTKYNKQWSPTDPYYYNCLTRP